VWAWGWGEHGMLGTGSLQDSPSPALILSARCVSVDAGGGASAVTTTSDNNAAADNSDNSADNKAITPGVTSDADSSVDDDVEVVAVCGSGFTIAFQQQDRA
jgi:hypothetical protein